MSLFLLSILANIPSSAIIQALTTEGVNPVININTIKTMLLITFIFDLEAFNLLNNVDVPINIIPDVCARYS